MKILSFYVLIYFIIIGFVINETTKRQRVPSCSNIFLKKNIKSVSYQWFYLAKSAVTTVDCRTVVHDVVSVCNVHM